MYLFAEGKGSADAHQQFWWGFSSCRKKMCSKYPHAQEKSSRPSAKRLANMRDIEGTLMKIQILPIFRCQVA